MKTKQKAFLLDGNGPRVNVVIADWLVTRKRWGCSAAAPSGSPLFLHRERFPPPAELKFGGWSDGAARRPIDRKSPTPAAVRRRGTGRGRVRLVSPT